MKRTIRLHEKPARIISLVPSQTELLFELGLDKEVVGITKFCIHPDSWFRTKTKIGGTKKLDANKIRALKPDLLIGNKEENEEGQILLLEKEFPVWMSDIHNLEQALEMVQSLGQLCERETQASEIIQKIKNQFRKFKPLSTGVRVLYLIWKNPYMAAGRNTFIDSMLNKCGFINCMDKDRYPELTEAEIQELNPDLILLSSEPFPFKEKHLKELQVFCPASEIKLADGEFFSWYGSRLLKAPAYFKELLSTLA
ncbi:MAG: ABC transporter substrate-binding protein [Bacteroidia bacterium]